MLKTLRELHREQDSINEGIENLIKTNKLKNHTALDWIEDKLTNFIITQDALQDKKDLEKKKEELRKEIEKKAEQDKDSNTENSNSEDSSTDTEEKDTFESEVELPTDDKGKIKGKVHVCIDKLYKEIDDNIRSSVKVFLYDVKYKDKVVGTLWITNKSLKELAVSPYDDVSAKLSLEGSKLNIKIHATKDVKESYNVYEGGGAYFGAIFGALGGLFTGKSSIATLGQSILGAMFGGAKDLYDKHKSVKEETKKIVDNARSKFVSEVKPDSFKDSDVANMMNLFYDPKTGTPRSAEDIRSSLKDVNPKDLDALTSKAQDYYKNHEAEVKAMNEWAESLSPEQKKTLDEQGKLNAQRLSAQKDIERDDEDIKSLEKELEALDGKDDAISKKAKEKLQEELESKKKHRKESTSKIDKLNQDIKTNSEKIEQLNKDKPKPTPADLEKKQAEEDAKDYEKCKEKTKELEQKLKKVETDAERAEVNDQLKKARMNELKAKYGGNTDSPDYQKELKTLTQKNNAPEIKAAEEDLTKATDKLKSAIESGDKSAIQDAMGEVERTSSKLNTLNGGLTDGETAKKIAAADQLVSNTAVIQGKRDEIDKLKKKAEEGTLEDQLVTQRKITGLQAEVADLKEPGKGKGAAVWTKFKSQETQLKQDLAKKAKDKAQKELEDAIDSGDKAAIDVAKKNLSSALKVEAEGKGELTVGMDEKVQEQIDNAEAKAKEKKYNELKSQSLTGKDLTDFKKLQDEVFANKTRGLKPGDVDKIRKEMYGSEASSIKDEIADRNIKTAQDNITDLERKLNDKSISPAEKVRLTSELYSAKKSLNDAKLAKYPNNEDLRKEKEELDKKENRDAFMKPARDAEAASRKQSELGDKATDLSNMRHLLNTSNENAEIEYNGEKYSYADLKKKYETDYKDTYRDCEDINSFKFERTPEEVNVDAILKQKQDILNAMKEAGKEGTQEYLQAQKNVIDAEHEVNKKKHKNDLVALAEDDKKYNEKIAENDKKIAQVKLDVAKGRLKKFEGKDPEKLPEEEKAEYDAAQGEIKAAKRRQYLAMHPDCKETNGEELDKLIIKDGKATEEELEAIKNGKIDDSKISSKKTELDKKLEEYKNCLKNNSLDAKKFQELHNKIEDLKSEVIDNGGTLSEEQNTNLISTATYIEQKRNSDLIKTELNNLEQGAHNVVDETTQSEYEKRIKEHKRKIVELYSGKKVDDLNDEQIENMFKDDSKDSVIPKDIRANINKKVNDSKDIAKANVEANKKTATEIYTAAEEVKTKGADTLKNEKTDYKDENGKELTWAEVKTNLDAGKKPNGEKLGEGESLSDEDSRLKNALDLFVDGNKEGSFKDYKKNDYDKKVEDRAKARADKQKKLNTLKDLKAKLERGEELTDDEAITWNEYANDKEIKKEAGKDYPVTPPSPKKEEKVDTKGTDTLKNEESDYEADGKKLSWAEVKANLDAGKKPDGKEGELTDDEKKIKDRLKVFTLTGEAGSFEEYQNKLNKADSDAAAAKQLEADIVTALDELTQKGEKEGLSGEDEEKWKGLCNSLKDQKNKDKYKANKLPQKKQEEKEKEEETQKISLSDEQSKELLELTGKDPRSDKDEIRMIALTLISKGLSEEEAKEKAEEEYKNKKTKEDSRKTQEMSLAVLVADDPKVVDTDSYKELVKNYKEKFGVDFNPKKALEIATDDEEGNSDENDEDGNDTKNINPAKIWHRRKRKDGKGLTKSYYSKDGKSSKTQDEFNDLMKAYREKKENNKIKADNAAKKANATANSETSTPTSESYRFKVRSNLKEARIRTLKDLRRR